MMNDDVLEIVIKKAFESAKKAVIFSFQGGEPTLVGLPFYQRLITYVKQYNQAHIQVNYNIQTNGVLLDMDWVNFLKENQFLVGISLDGVKDVHNQNRFDTLGQGTFNQVLKAIDMLKKGKVDFNILTVINNSLARYPEKIYNFYKKQQFKYLQFIPCIAPLGMKQGEDELSLTPKRYETFLNDLFQLWYNDFLKGDVVSIRYFDNLIGIILGFAPQSCDMKGACSLNLVIEGNGNVYPCDFYVVNEWLIGNVADMSFDEIISDPKSHQFINQSLNVNEKCKSCSYYQLCRGGCVRHRQNDVTQDLQLNVFCESYEAFFAKNITKLEEIARFYIKNNKNMSR